MSFTHTTFAQQNDFLFSGLEIEHNDLAITRIQKILINDRSEFETLSFNENQSTSQKDTSKIKWHYLGPFIGATLAVNISLYKIFQGAY